MVTTIPYPQSNQQTYDSAPLLSLIGHPVRVPQYAQPLPRAPPFLGQHTREVCVELLGMSHRDVDGLINKGVIKQNSRFEIED